MFRLAAYRLAALGLVLAGTGLAALAGPTPPAAASPVPRPEAVATPRPLRVLPVPALPVPAFPVLAETPAPRRAADPPGSESLWVIGVFQ